VVAPAIDAPWIIARPAEAPDWEFDVGPFAGTPTSYEALGGTLFTTSRIVSSTFYGWAVNQLTTTVVPVNTIWRSSTLAWMSAYDLLPASTLTSLELVGFKYGNAVTSSTFRAIKALTLHRINPWSRFLAGFDPVPTAPTPASSEPVSAVRADAAELVVADSKELDAVEDLRRWLGVTYEQVAAATNIGLRTVHHWKQSGAAPRPRTVRTLWRLHSLVHSIRRTLGPEEATGWLRSSSPSPLDLILAGDLAAVEDKARGLLFGEPIGERRFSGLAIVDQAVQPAARGRRTVARATRMPKIARRGAGT
jgi:DNA-binding transcriptional regulator YiaG